MSKIIDLYLDRVLSAAELSSQKAAEVREELSDHLLSHYDKSLASGENSEDASLSAIAKMGHPKTVGTKIARPWQWIDIRTEGTAKGFIAIGPKAIGIIAFGNVSCGILSIGAISTGIIAFGALSFGIFTWAAIATGLVALGGMAIGIVASGGVAIGLLAEGIATLAPTQSPEFLQALLSFPRWMMRNMAVIVPAYVCIVGIAGAFIGVRSARKREKLSHWIFD